MAVIVAALGYFVDIYDLVLFSIVRVPSLKALGYSGTDLTDRGVLLINLQMLGMLAGGILWGVSGDRRGRKSVLFGSILLYSLANLANGMAGSIESYAALRLLAGLGLAGELGAGITLVSEVLSTELRGYGTMMVASFGTSGAILAGYIGQAFDWRTCYFVGGALGLLLLFLRIGVLDSSMFQSAVAQDVPRGRFLSLFRDRQVFLRYLRCIVIGVPIWYCIGILITFSPEFSGPLGIGGTVSGARAILWSYLGLTVGDFTSGWLSQRVRSRNKVVLAFLVGTTLSIAAFFLLRGEGEVLFYLLVTVVGFFAGYWAVFVAIAAEQFGTNLRATVATTVPNFVRGSLVIMASLFQSLHPRVGYLKSGEIVAALALAVAFWGCLGLTETYGKSLDYVEEMG